MELGTRQDRSGRCAPNKGVPANLLLRSLSRDDMATVQRHLFPCELRRDEDVCSHPGSGQLILFPERGILNLLFMTGNKSCPIALFGYEGMANHHLLFPHPQPAYRISVQVEGSALAIAVRDFRELISVMPNLRQAYLRFVTAIQVQVASTLRSSMSDTVEQRLARLLLMYRDRTDDDRMHLIHSDLSDVLGVRRASITDALHRIEGCSAISNTRGLISIRDRGRLKGIAGESYGAAEMLHSSKAESLPSLV